VAYADFTLESVEPAFGLTIKPGELFPGLSPVAVPAWLEQLLKRGRAAAALVSEKARSEILVVPVLLAAQEFATAELSIDMSIYSGQRLDIDPARGLAGECDYILALAPPLPRLRAPLVAVLEAKKADVEACLGQCVAQMVGLQLFNERAGEPPRPIYGCVTSGEVWQFLRLQQAAVLIDRDRLFINDVGDILAVLRALVTGAAPKPAAQPAGTAVAGS
jgi:hypothetical protein